MATRRDEIASMSEEELDDLIASKAAVERSEERARNAARAVPSMASARAKRVRRTFLDVVDSHLAAAEMANSAAQSAAGDGAVMALGRLKKDLEALDVRGLSDKED